MSKPTVDKKFITQLQGKDFVTYEGLLDLAHQSGLKSIKTEIIQLPNKENESTCIVKAVAITENGEFHGIGDADPKSVNKHIIPHLIRMAETRAKARALRDLTNVGMTAVEEMGGDSEVGKPNGNQGNGEKASDKQLNYISNLIKSSKKDSKMIATEMQKLFNTRNIQELTKAQGVIFINKLKEWQ